MAKTDKQLQQDVEDELRWDPKVNAAQIGVTVNGGAVTLLGAVDTYAERSAAEAATKRVSGVRIVADDLTVKVLTNHQRSDSEIATAIENAFKWDVYVPKTVTAIVHEGDVTIEGAVEWHHQREAAERAVRNWTGIVSVNNAITLKPAVSADVVKEHVLAALERQADTDAKNIKVEISGSRVTLTGHTSTWQAVENATRAAWGAPGVTEVIERVIRQ